ncbi:hypothetical protein L1D14_10505 [Vibrio tubiashii]|uniref:hypothetical protein n=1 Tax=Vibrio tubiashii TaxID=29498 RepID=UPI001EFEDE4E|nr:hypothetical protein [Vibrio tubiashii]MCG9576668.1 hypothetical protein [Vibrio tubiashii]
MLDISQQVNKVYFALTGFEKSVPTIEGCEPEVCEFVLLNAAKNLRGDFLDIETVYETYKLAKHALLNHFEGRVGNQPEEGDALCVEGSPSTLFMANGLGSDYPLAYGIPRAYYRGESDVRVYTSGGTGYLNPVAPLTDEHWRFEKAGVHESSVQLILGPDIHLHDPSPFIVKVSVPRWNMIRKTLVDA